MKKILATAAALSGLMLIAVNGAQAKDAVEAGTLKCSVAPGVGLIVGSSKPLECEYSSSDGQIIEPYFGNVTKLGLDIGVTGESVIVWQVFAPTDGLRPGALEGSYAGATAQATAGVGVGANALVGGSEDTISLQPLSVSAQSGVNVAAGIASIELKSPVK